jgi:hypothetical protein
MNETRTKLEPRWPRQDRGHRSLGQRHGPERCPRQDEAPAAPGRAGAGIHRAGIGRAAAVALTGALLCACGPKVAPSGPGPAPAGSTRKTAPAPARVEPSARPPFREVLVGEMCPRAADGRPAVKPLFVRALGWSDAAEDAATAIERRAARQFSVLAWDGRRAGLFSVAGIGEVGDQDVAVGAYAGSSPCARPRDAGDAGYHPDCVTAQDHCGLAVATLERGRLDEQPFEADPDPLSLTPGGACVAGDKLLVDIDGDGSEEAFVARDFVNAVWAPAEEVLAVARSNETCTPAFAMHHAVQPGDPRHWRGLDVVGVVDLDGDGRREIIVAYHYAARRTWAIYSAASTAGRLDLVGEAEPWVK